MIGLVVVSHSRALAEAAVRLAAEMTPSGSPPVEVAAGLDETTTGTDATAVAEALTRADEASGGRGVLVLLDLGSAVLSAEMALELVEPQVAARVRLSSAPLVEGLVAAVVAASGGAGLESVAREAELGLQAKAVHLDGVEPAGGPGHEEPAHCEHATAGAQPVRSVELPVTGEHGLHARPAARVVACAAAVSPATAVRLRNLTSGRGPVDATSLSGVATLDARRGHVLLAEAQGPRADEVLEVLTALSSEAFGDAPAAGADGDDGTDGRAAALEDEPTVGSGLDVAVGPVVRLRGHRDDELDLAAHRDGDGTSTRDVATERARWEAAVGTAERRLEELAQETRLRLGTGAAEVFAAHATLLRDPELARAVDRRLERGDTAVLAWRSAVAELAGRFEALSDPYQRDRAHDVRSVGDRVLRALLDLPEPEAPGEGVLVVDELDPALAVSVDAASVRGIITLRDGDTGHGVLIAASRGLPVLTGAPALGDVRPGTLVAFDARSRRLEVDPPPEVLAAFDELLAQRAAERSRAQAKATAPVVTTDGTALSVLANVSSLAGARLAATMGADGAGLVRTEALFGHWRAAPTVAQQVEAYAAIAEALAPHPVTIRTWDVGGDKPLPFIPSVSEANPFLGARGLRAFVREPEALLDQLEALCRVAAKHPVRVLFPMVTTRADVDLALELLDEAVRRAGAGAGRPPAGIMVEVPAAALSVGNLVAGLDFLSVGSNDLSQYVLAAERGNLDLARWSDHLEPAVLRLVRATCEGVPDGVAVGLCGAMAADPDLAGLLAGLGVRELSTVPAAVPLVKERLREGSVEAFGELAERALACHDAAAVRALVRQGS